MADSDPVEVVKDSVSVVVEVLRAAGDDPKVREAASNLGESAVTLTKTINNVLVPLAAINFAFDKARAYFAGRFQSDMAEKAKCIPVEDIVEPKASIAGPALQGLAFTHEEPNLKEMYLNLLATAMDGRMSGSAHPAFVEIIKQLDGADAVLVRTPLSTNVLLPIAQIIVRQKSGTGYIVLATHVMDLQKRETKEPFEDPHLPAMVDNWIRLGLVEVTYDRQMAADENYAWVKHRPEFIRYNELYANANDEIVDLKKGTLQRTELGKRFAISTGLRVE